MTMNEQQFCLLKRQLENILKNDAFYINKFKQIGLDISDIQTPDDLIKLPFTTKEELRDAYPLGHQAVPDEQVVRIHSSSGTLY